jgi:uncharacterized repeat protein (TIGR01451 family)
MHSGLLSAPARPGLFRRAVLFWLVAFLSFGPSLIAATYHVDDTGGDDTRTPAQAQNPATPWRTITRALTSGLVAGDIVRVHEGTYAAPPASPTPAPGESYPLELIDGVQIIGDSAANTFLTPPSGTPAFVNGDEVLGSTTLLSNVTLTHDSPGAFSPLMYFYVGGGAMAPRIENNVFDGDPSDFDTGILIAGSGGGGSFTGTISGNTFTEFGEPSYNSPPYSYYGTGVAITEFPNPSPSPDNLSPTIQNNTFSLNTQGVNVSEYFYYFGNGERAASKVEARDSAGTMAPVIDTNTFTGNAFDNVLFYAGFTIANFSPSITGNTSTGSFIHVLAFPFFFLPGKGTPAARQQFSPGRWRSGAIEKRFRIGGPPRPAFKWVNARQSFESWAANRGRPKSGRVVRPHAFNNTFGPTISGNTVTLGAPGLAGVLMYQIFYYADTLGIDLEVDGNVVNGGVGAAMLLAVPSESPEVPDNISITNNTFDGAGSGQIFGPGNTVTISTGFFGPPLPPASAKQAQATANVVSITGNVIRNMAGEGLVLESDNYSTLPFVVECNTITGNGGSGVVQVEQTDPNADLGGGGFSSGRNNIFGNGLSPSPSPSPSPGSFDLFNDDADPMFAENNWWGTTDSATIDSRIADNEEATGGAVDFTPFATSLQSCAVLETADLQISKSGPATAIVGGQITWTLTALNTGPAFAPGITIIDTLPAGMTFVSASANGHCVPQAGNTVRCLPGSLFVNQPVAITLTATAPGTPGPVTNVVTIGSDLIVDPNAANNTAQFTTDVQAATSTADLVINKTVAPPVVAPGGQLTFTLTVTNNGPGDATGVVITDPLPAGTTFVSASAGCTNSAGTVTCNVGTLTSGASQQRSIIVTAPSTPGQVVNTATVASASGDPDPSDNSSGAAAVVQPAVADIPTLNEWALIILALMLMGSAVVMMGRKGIIG